MKSIFAINKFRFLALLHNWKNVLTTFWFQADDMCFTLGRILTDNF